jgi:transposase
MERRVAQQEFNPQNCQVVAFDVSAATLNWYTEEPGPGSRILERESQIANRTAAISESLKGLSELAARQGKTLLVVCEPSGGYERKLLRLARAQGALTCYVSGEATHKLTILESNDTSKNDPKDARVIYRIAGLRTALLTDRQTDPGYEQLRELNRFYEDEDERVVQLRNAISSVRRQLFCDLRANSDFLFGKTGQAFLTLYRGNPNRAVVDGWEGFQQKLKQLCPRAAAETLRRLWQDVQSSVRLLVPPGVMAQWEDRLATLMEDWHRHQSRKAAVKATMVGLYERTPEFSRLMGSGVSAFALARIIAETGPLSDYQSWRQLLRLAGLNLNVRQSGKYRGQTRISKKGNCLLRKVLYQQAFAVLTQGRGLFADYFTRRRQGAPPVLAKKLYVNVMRKFLRALFGAYQDGGFIPARVFLDESHYAQRQVA